MSDPATVSEEVGITGGGSGGGGDDGGNLLQPPTPTGSKHPQKVKTKRRKEHVEEPVFHLHDSPSSTSLGNGGEGGIDSAEADEADDQMGTNVLGKFSNNSRITFSSESVTIKASGSAIFEKIEEMDEVDHSRDGWDNKTQFFLGVISYAVGFGNVWRFPALLQKNGGGAFLIPYIIMMVVEGMPLFLIELGIGQRLRTGPVGVWNAIHPYLGGVGVSAAIVSYLVGLYYNVILTWVIYYLFESFRPTLPWTSCPTRESGTNISLVEECERSTSVTNYFWNREAIDISSSIGDIGGFTTHITICLIFAWILIYLCVMKGIKSSGKVMYLTATFPYLVTTIFLVRSLMLDGAMDGLMYMLSPDLTRLYDPEVWLEASTQVFYSMGLGFGGLIAFASYNKLTNNCKKDCIQLSAVNLLTSLYTAVVIFCVLGYMGHRNYIQCIEKDMEIVLAKFGAKVGFNSVAEFRTNVSVAEYAYMIEHNFHMSPFPEMSEFSQKCDYRQIIGQAAEGTGLAFVVFTEAILQFPMPPLWAIMFFMMLLTLGLGSMFGTLEGVITSLNDSQFITLKKPVLSAILCGSACIIGLVFTTKAGVYWVRLFDHFAGSYALLCVAFFEVVAVIYIYGWRRFRRDLEFMTKEPLGCFWIFTWRFVSPTIMLVLFSCSIVKSLSHVPGYFAYDSSTTHQHSVDYPTWALFIAFALVAISLAPVPFVWFVRKFKIWKVDYPYDMPVAAKCLGTTPSTTHMFKSLPSFNRMAEGSTASDLVGMARGVQSKAPNVANGVSNGGSGRLLLDSQLATNGNVKNAQKVALNMPQQWDAPGKQDAAKDKKKTNGGSGEGGHEGNAATRDRRKASS